ncbi:MAG: branched-chain amino acid transport system substrate-binding protein [Gaiellaceae bacterium]|nr:branched-chain amino acid transport system substrate-binding protein [Gaiellaceae bacterium]
MIAHIAAAALALGAPSATPGVAAGTITIGGTIPISGPAAAYGSVGRGADAYFKYINSKGGVFGRKIDYKYLDDEFDVAKTITLTRQLVEQDQVLAIFNSVGTEHALAIRSYLNDRKVPQLFLGSGVSSLAREHAKYPWSMGYLPSFAGEGAIYGRYVASHQPKAKIAVLYENSDFGKDMLNGLRRGLGGKAKIVGTQAYEIADADISSQMARLKSSGADTLMLFATPQFAIFGYVGAFRLGWHPQVYVTSVSISPDIMKIARVASSRKQVEGSVSIAFVKDPTSKQWAKDGAVRLYQSILRRFLPSAKAEDVFNYYGMAVAYTMVDTLKKAGRNPTRAGLLKAATHLRETNPFLLPGLRVRTSPSDYYPIDQVKLARYRANRWQFFGKFVNARD